MKEVEMSGGTWRAMLALVMMAHGIGHVLLLAPCLGIAQWGQSAQSWLLTGTLGDALTRLIGSLLWLSVIAGFVAAGVGLLGQHTWWRTVAVGAAGVSILALVLFANADALQPLVSAAAMDVAVLVALLWLQWPSAYLVGA
jgi:hypothetical protein